MAEWKPEVEMPKQSSEERIHNFEEVAKGYTEEMAVEEAERCLSCPNPQCIKGCPVDIDIAAVTRIADTASYRMDDIIIAQYSAFTSHASDCTECGVCTDRCPFGVDVVVNMKRAVELLGR